MTLQEALNESFNRYAEELKRLVQPPEGQKLMFFFRDYHGCGQSVIRQVPDNGTNPVVMEQSVLIARFLMTGVLNCRPVVLCTHVNVNEAYRNRGIGSVVQKMRCWAAQQSDHKVMMCTTLKNNEYQNRILANFKYARVSEFTNPHTGNDVIIWKKELPDDSL